MSRRIQENGLGQPRPGSFSHHQGLKVSLATNPAFTCFANFHFFHAYWPHKAARDWGVRWARRQWQKWRWCESRCQTRQQHLKITWQHWRSEQTNRGDSKWNSEGETTIFQISPHFEQQNRTEQTKQGTRRNTTSQIIVALPRLKTLTNNCVATGDDFATTNAMRKPRRHTLSNETAKCRSCVRI